MLIAELDEFKGGWPAMGALAPERLNALRRAATIESIGSSIRLEGSKLSDAEVEKLLSDLQVKSFKTRDEEKVAGDADLMETIFTNWRHIPLTEDDIRQLHRGLHKFSKKNERHFEIPGRMAELVEWTNRAFEDRWHHPLIIMAVFNVVFLEIHPFQDGNGRLLRALTTLLLLRANYLYVPYSSLENIIEQNKRAYYLALRKTKTTLRHEHPDWQPWITFFLKALHQQKQRLEVKVARERLMQEKLPDLSIQILELAEEHGRIHLSGATAATTANRNTVKKHLQQLVSNSYLTMQGKGKNTWYTLHSYK